MVDGGFGEGMMEVEQGVDVETVATESFEGVMLVLAGIPTSMG